MSNPLLRGSSTVARLALAAALVASIGLPGAAAAADPASATGQLEETRSSLEQARAGVDAADLAVEQAQAQLAAIHEQLAVRTAELTRLEADLAAAEEAWRAARERTRRSSIELRGLADEVKALIADHDAHRGAMDQRAAEIYKGGGGAHTGALFTTMLGVTNLHDLSVGKRALDATLEQDRDLAARTRALTLRTIERRAALAEARARRQDEEAQARLAHERVATLVRRQQVIIGQVSDERERRQVLLTGLEADRDRALALARQVQASVAAISGELRRELMEGWQDLPADGPVPAWAGGLPARGQRWASAIDTAARANGIDPRLFAALVWSESSFHPGAVSHAGALGLAQLMPGTARMLGVDPFDPAQNLHGGARYLSTQLATFGSPELALAAYNAGPGAVRKYGGIPPYAETQLYVITVLKRYAAIAGH